MPLPNKKLLTTALCCAVLSAQAATCPPDSAFIHVAQGQEWKLSNAYQSEWRISFNPAANQSDVKILHPRSMLNVRLFPSTANNNFLEECRYQMGNLIIWVYSNNDYKINPAKFTNFNPKDYGRGTNYICTTVAGSPDKCQWN